MTGGHALIADLNPEHRAASLNLLDVFFGIGAFVTPFAIVPLQARGGTAAVLFTLAALAAAGLVFLLLVRFPPAARGHAIAPGTIRSMVTSPLFLLPALLVFLYVGTEQSVWDWQVTYFMRTLSMDNVAAAPFQFSSSIWSRPCRKTFIASSFAFEFWMKRLSLPSSWAETPATTFLALRPSRPPATRADNKTRPPKRSSLRSC